MPVTPSLLERLEAALASPAPLAAAADLAYGLDDPDLLDVLLRLESRRLVRLGPGPDSPGGLTPAGLVSVSGSLAEAGRLPLATPSGIRDFLRRTHDAVVAAGAWRPEAPPWWRALPPPGPAEAVFAQLDAAPVAAVGTALAASFGPGAARRWLALPDVLPADLCRSLHAALEDAFRSGGLDLEAGTVAGGRHSAARQDAVHYLTGLEPHLFPRLAPLAALVQWSLHRLLPRIAAAHPESTAIHPPATAMLARYPGPSGGYRPHLDNPGGAADNGRRLATLLYLNHPDDPPDGGELAVWETGAPATGPPAQEIAPRGGTLAAFDSTATLHAVRPLGPGPARWSLAMWLNAQPVSPRDLPAIPDMTVTDVLVPVPAPPLPAGTVLFHEVQDPDPPGAVVGVRSGSAPARAGMVATVYGAGDDLGRWCRHHFAAGFAHLVLVFDHIDEPAEAAAADRLREAFPATHLTIWSTVALRDGRWPDDGELIAAAAHGAAPQAVAARQALNATVALQAAATAELGGAPLDWLVHLDADELFHLEGTGRGGGDAGEHFAALTRAGVAAATYLNHELLLPRPPGRAPAFKANPRLARARLGPAGWPALAAHLRARDIDPRPYFSGYVNGKAAVAVAAGAAAAGVHGWRLRKSGRRVVLAGPSILHYRFATGAAYTGKYLAMADAATEPGLFAAGEADRAAIDLARRLRGEGAGETAIRDRLLGLRDRLTGFTAAEADLLDEAGLLLRPALAHGLAVDGTAPRPAPVRIAEQRPRASVGIVGGGTAGYLTALALRRYHPDLAVTVIESPDRPVIGVGEATTPLMPQFLHADLDFDVHEFFREVHPTFKLGIRFAWGGPGQPGFNYPFGPADVPDAYRHDGHLEAASLRSLMMTAEVLPVEESGPAGPVAQLDWMTAYHLENRRFVAYLAAMAARRGVRREEATVTDVVVAAPDRGAEALLTTDGRRLSYDWYADCSGFSSLLMGATLGSGFVDYGDALFTDAAVVAAIPRNGRLPPYTGAEAMAAGWCWSTPQLEADHRGYVFSSAFASPEDAAAEMRRRHPGMGDHRLLRFRPGRRRHFQRGNVFALGNAYGFVEPLESTALHMVIRQIGLLLAALADPDGAGEDARNRRVGEYWDYLAWFLAIHYRFNRRLDTPFWRACRRDADVGRHGELLETFRARGPLSVAGDDGFDYPDPLLWGPEGIDTILLGQQVPAPLPAGGRTPPEWSAVTARRRRLVQRATGHERTLALLAAQPDLGDRHARRLAERGRAFRLR